jgi:hypothetical protein
MREVVVEHVGGETRTIHVGREKKKKRTESFRDVICSPRILPNTGSDEETHASKCWKTTKRGLPHAKKGWQRHGETKRRKYGRTRWSGWPSTKTLNELGRCIYPNMGG